MLKKIIALSTLVFSVLTLNLTAQNLELPLVFDDHMVLQRNADIRIWGWADAGTSVTVKLNEVSRTATAGMKDGRWETLLPAHQAGGPFTVTISAGAESLVLQDVYVGDVWIAGGQSNMEWKLNWEVENWEEEVAKSGDSPEIRFFDTPQATAHSPQNRLPGGEWKISNPKIAGNFSAVAWYFAKLNHTQKDVPIGIVESNWGGTPAEAWTPADRLLTVAGYREAAKRVLDPNIDWEQELAENEERQRQKNILVSDPSLGLEAEVITPDFNDDNWERVILPNPKPLSDVAWLRRTVTITQDEINSAKLFTGDISQESFFYINGEEVGQKSWQESNTTFEIDPVVLETGTNVIAFRAVNSWNNKVRIGGNNNMYLTVNEDTTDLTGEWKYSNRIEPKIPEVIRYEWEPGFLYNAMINPLAGYTIKGAIWYQGESNVGVNQYYNALFEAMIEEWRKSWNQGDFPFLYVQLANYLQKQDEPYDSDWARLREAQTQTLSLANTGMATIIDIGDAEDIHPRNKHDVGKRLWLTAQKVAFGEQLVYSGPMYRSHTVEGNEIRIAFNHEGGGLVNKGEGDIPGFAIAGADKKFHWANVKIEDNQIVVWSDEVENPVAVRYAWADNPDVTLYNEEGLPTVPFRTDNWN